MVMRAINHGLGKTLYFCSVLILLTDTEANTLRVTRILVGFPQVWVTSDIVISKRRLKRCLLKQIRYTKAKEMKYSSSAGISRGVLETPTSSLLGKGAGKEEALIAASCREGHNCLRNLLQKLFVRTNDNILNFPIHFSVEFFSAPLPGVESGPVMPPCAAGMA